MRLFRNVKPSIALLAGLSCFAQFATAQNTAPAQVLFNNVHATIAVTVLFMLANSDSSGTAGEKRRRSHPEIVHQH